MVKESQLSFQITLAAGEDFFGCSSLTNTRIPEGVTEIGNNAFEDIQHIIYHGPAQ